MLIYCNVNFEYLITKEVLILSFTLISKPLKLDNPYRNKIIHGYMVAPLNLCTIIRIDLIIFSVNLFYLIFKIILNLVK